MSLKSALFRTNPRVLVNILRTQSTVASTNFDAPKPFEEIPTISEKHFFKDIVFGNVHHLIVGSMDEMSERTKNIYHKYGNGHPMMRFHVGKMMQLSGVDQNLVMLFDPEIIKETYRQEGKYPNRGVGFAAFKKWREDRRDIFTDNVGVLASDGPEWQELRSKVQQDLMRPKSAFYYIDTLNQVGDEFIEYVRRLRETSADGLMPDDFLKDYLKYGFESINLVALDTKLGLLSENPDPEVQKVMEAIEKSLTNFGEVLLNPAWKISPHLSTPYKNMVDGFEVFADFAKRKIDEAMEKVKSKTTGNNDEIEVSILEKLIAKCGPNSCFPIVMAFDLTLAGSDTTGNSAAFLHYYLARNPEVQEKLRAEVKGKELNAQTLGKMRYLKACMKESFRLTPIVFGMLRVMPEDAVIGGYHIPAGTFVQWDSAFLGKDKVENPEKFMPERWLKDSEEFENIHPFAVLPFSHGPRMCIGKRFAELEIQLLTCKMLQNFRIEWGGGEVQGKFSRWQGVISPGFPLKFRFVDI